MMMMMCDVGWFSV